MAFDLSKNEDLQRLFLLELLVDSVKFDYKKVDLPKSTLELLKQTCVRFNFLNFPVIEVCEEDFCQTQDNYNMVSDIVFKNGKSCFFSLHGLPHKTQCLKLGVTVVRKRDESPPIIMGTTCITLDRGFVDVLNDMNYNTETDEASKSLKDVFPIIDSKGIKIGCLALLIRLSCFGKAIITHFKIPQEKEAGYMFANTNEPNRQVDPTTAQVRTPIPLGHPHQNEQVTPPDKNNIFYPGMSSGAPPGTGIPETVLGSTPMGESYISENVQKTSPMIYRGFRSNTPNVQGTFPGDTPGAFPGVAQGTFTSATPGTLPGASPGNFPHTAPGSFPQTSPSTFPQPAPLTFPQTPPGMFPQTAHGTFPSTLPDTFLQTAHGIFPEAGPGGIERAEAFPGAAVGNFPQATTGPFQRTAPETYSWNTPGTFSGIPANTLSQTTAGALNEVQENFPRTAPYTPLRNGFDQFSQPAQGKFPESAPRTFPGTVPGNFPAPGMLPENATRTFYDATPGTFPEAAPGMYPTIQNPIQTTPAGEPGQALYKAAAPQYVPTYPSEIGMGENMGISPHPQTVLFNATSECCIDNNMGGKYKELSVSVNGHEFTINVLRKSRPKKEKPQPLQFCGRVPEIESSDSDESIEPVLDEEIEDEYKEKEDEEKEEEVPKIEESNLIKKEKKFLQPTNPEPLPVVAPPIQQNYEFRLCECDIALPKGFRLPEPPASNKRPKLQTPPTPPPSPVDKVVEEQDDFPPQSASKQIPVKTKLPLPPATVVSRLQNDSVVKETKKIVKPCKKVEEVPKSVYCLQPDCPMGFPWPSDIPKQKKVIKVPCCSQMPMHPGSIGVKENQIVFQMTDGTTPDYGHYQSFINDDEQSPYILKLGSNNLSKCKCTKMILELPVPKLEIKKIVRDDQDTQYLESDIPFIEKLKTDEGKKKGKGGKAGNGKKGGIGKKTGAGKQGGIKGGIAGKKK